MDALIETITLTETVHDKDANREATRQVNIKCKKIMVSIMKLIGRILNSIRNIRLDISTVCVNHMGKIIYLIYYACS